jgi:transcriptional regulator with XRE-family HTH domain
MTVANGSNAKTRYLFRLRRRPILRDLGRLNISQNELAQKCGISSGFMSQLLSGERHAGPSTRRRIMEALPGVEFNELFEEIEVGG